MCSQNNLTHKYISERYNMTVETLGTLTSSEMLDLFMKWYSYAYTEKMIDDSWLEALHEAKDFVIENNFTVTENMTLKQFLPFSRHLRDR